MVLFIILIIVAVITPFIYYWVRLNEEVAQWKEVNKTTTLNSHPYMMPRRK